MLGFNRTEPPVIQTGAGLFSNKVISRNGDINWPARSSNLSAVDFFLLGGGGLKRKGGSERYST